jgi:thiol:disulfide interchange protein DsbD
VILLASILFFFGLNLLGIFEIQASSLMSVGQSLTSKKNYAGSFFTGVFATWVATPCTAPFM